MCEQLQALTSNAARVLRELKRIRRAKDISFFEDVALTQHKHQTLHQVLKHLLVGHNGMPCPSAPRPVVDAGTLSRRYRDPYRFSARPPDSLHDAFVEARSWVVEWMRVPPLSITRPSRSPDP
jgi:hypothetical protein